MTKPEKRRLRRRINGAFLSAVEIAPDTIRLWRNDWTELVRIIEPTDPQHAAA